MPDEMDRRTFAPNASDATGRFSTEYLREIAEHRKHRDQDAFATDGWISVVGLHWLEPGETSFGSGVDQGFCVEGLRLPHHVGTFVRDGSSVVFRAASAGTVRVNGVAVETIPMVPDSSPNTTVLEIGDIRVYIIDREYQWGVRVKDLGAAGRRLEVPTLDYFPIDLMWRLPGAVIRRQASCDVQDIFGFTRTYDSTVVLRCALGGRDYDLVSFDPPQYVRYQFGMDRTDVSIVFSDASTAPHFRMLTVRVPATGPVVIDFNKAENAPCAFSPHVPCPLPPAANRIECAIKAGEKLFELQS